MRQSVINSCDRLLDPVRGSVKVIFHCGPSMSPTLRSSDLLYVVPYNGGRIRCGDVIVFSQTQGGAQIAHRVVKSDGRGIRTRGDNNSHVDPYILRPEDIIGRVALVRRGSRRRRIHGGFLGRIIGKAMVARRAVIANTWRPLRPLYRGLARSGLGGYVLPPNLRPRVVSLKRFEGTEFLIFMGSRVVGKLPVGEKSWRIDPPFRLFVDENTLPKRDVRPCNEKGS